MRRTLPLALLLVTAVSAGRAQSSLAGTVRQKDGESLRPLADVYVQAKSGSPAEVIAQAQTDVRGHYNLANLPAGRVTASVAARGYYTLRAGELDSETIALSCPAAGSCGQVDFVLAPAVVFEGWLSDEFGDPLQDMEVSLTPAGEVAAAPSDGAFQRSRSGAQAISDDRGYFRIWGLKPGSYLLQTEQRPFRGPGWGAQYRAEPRQVEIGDQTRALHLTMQSDAEVYSLTGRIEGVPPGELQRATIMIQPKLPADADSSRFWGASHSLRDGQFKVEGLPRGDYIARLAKYELSGEPREALLLRELHVDRNLTDLRLTPLPPTGLRGRLRFRDGNPAVVHLWLRPTDQAGATEPLRVQREDRSFEHLGVLPGRYELAARTSDRYIVAPREITIAAGVVSEVEVVLSSEFATVRGRVRLAGEPPQTAAAHFLVALRGDRGRHVSQADENGGFLFEKVVPGDYEIAAWPDLHVAVAEEAPWRHAGESVKRFTAEPGFDIELELTTAP